MGTIHFLRNRWLTIVHDLVWVVLAIVAAYWMRYNLSAIPVTEFASLSTLVLIALPIHALSFWFFGCFRGLWRFASIPDLLRFVKAVAIGAPITAALYLSYVPLPDPPRTVLALYSVFLLVGVIGGRVTYRVITDLWDNPEVEEKKRALLIGAGRAGDLLVRDLLSHGPFRPVAFLDDNVAKRNHTLHGVRVIGQISDLARVIDRRAIDAVLISMPSANRATLENIVTVCADLGIECRTLPSLSEIANGRVAVSSLRPVTVEDLLGREPVDISLTAIARSLTGKRVLVTGGGGSIGSELCRQILRYQPEKLIIVDQSEYNLYAADRSITEHGPVTNVELVLGDCTHQSSMQRLFQRTDPQIVFHAAAYKHVPMVECNAVEGVRNNVVGTRVIADCADRNGVETFVLISTDKTVNPANVMGASKRVAELYCSALGRRSSTRFITTRFGNVLASAGSVVPLFEDQIRKGGPVTVTHPDVTRFFMTIPEAVGLILQAATMGTGGEIFVLDMGQPVKILHLAEKMVQLCGLQPGRDIEIKFTGLRPGEKLYEELFYQSESLQQTTHPKLLLATSDCAEVSKLQTELAVLERAVEQADTKLLRITLQKLVPGFCEMENGLRKVATPALKVV